jgi:hypothetical protein
MSTTNDAHAENQSKTQQPDKALVNFMQKRLENLLSTISTSLKKEDRDRVLKKLGRHCGQGLAKRFAGNPEGFWKLAKSQWIDTVDYNKDKGIIHITEKERKTCNCPLAKMFKLPTCMCICSTGAQETIYESLFNTSVDVKLEESVLTKGNRCRFTITLLPKTKSHKILGTWVKYYTNKEGGQYKADHKLHLFVTFDHDGHFLWDCKQYGDNGQIVDESLTGTYSFERGFLITYKFDKPSPSAQKSLSKFFAFWPNQMKGQQTFKFHDDTLILGHDGKKMWFYLRRKDEAEHTTKQNSRENTAPG